MYGNGREPVNWIAWSFGLFLIGIMLIVSGYMFVVYLKSQHKKNQEDEQRRIEEQKSFKNQLAKNSQSGLSSVESVKEEGVSEKQPETEYPESSRIEEPSAIVKPPPSGNVCVAPSVVNSNPAPAPKEGSKEPSTEELSSKKSLTDLKPIISKPEEKNDGEISVEIVPNAQIPTAPVEKRGILSAEKAPGSSIGSDVSTYVISSQRSEVNNYNQLEAGRTPPTFSNTENIFHRTSSIESLAPNTAAPSSTGTVVPLAKQSSETIVSLPTPPLKK